MTSFGKPSCALCMKEKIQILQALRNNPQSTINTQNKLYGACRHNTKFHRYKNYTISADEKLFIPKRVSQCTRLPELIFPDESNSLFVCQDCVSNTTYPPITRGDNDTAGNV